MVICQKRVANDLHMISLLLLSRHRLCFIKIQNGSPIPLLAYPGCPGKEAGKRMCIDFVTLPDSEDFVVLLVMQMSPNV